MVCYRTDRVGYPKSFRKGFSCLLKVYRGLWYVISFDLRRSKLEVEIAYLAAAQHATTLRGLATLVCFISPLRGKTDYRIVSHLRSLATFFHGQWRTHEKFGCEVPRPVLLMPLTATKLRHISAKAHVMELNISSLLYFVLSVYANPCLLAE